MRILSYLVILFWVVTLGRTILNLLLIPRLRAGQRPQREPMVSVIIPARDEERTIERTVRGMLSQTYSALEIIVVNDRSADETGAILERLASEDGRLRVLTGEEPPGGWLGKPWALHQGSLKARGELLLFVDADIIYQPGAIAAAVARREESDATLVSILPNIEMRGFWENIAMPNLAMVVTTVVPLWLANRTRLTLLAAGGGPGNLVRRTEYDAAGGHTALKDAVVDDIALARLIRGAGGRTEMVMGNEVISVRMYHGLREVIDGFTKNAFTVFGKSYLAVLLILAISLVVHVLPYAMMFTGDPYFIAAVALITLVRLLVFTSLGYRLDNAVLGHAPMVLLWSFIILRSAWITGVRKQLHWRGRSYDAGNTRFGAD